MAAAASLAEHPCFRDADAGLLERLDAACTWIRAVPGQWLIDDSDGGTFVFFVLTGRVRALLHSLRQDLTLADIEAGSFFGEMSAIDGDRRSATVIAVNASLIASMPAAAFLDAVFTHRPLGLTVLSVLTRRLRQLNRRVAELSTLDVRHRLYAELLRLARPDRTDATRAIISPVLSQSDLAARISTQRETVSREIAAMERGGMIERRRGALVLTDALALTASVERAAAG